MFNYTPLFAKYQELWAKYSNTLPTETLTTPKLKTQEESVKWSLELKGALEAIAAENKMEVGNLIYAFLYGAKIGTPTNELTRTHWGMARVNLTLRIAKGENLAISNIGTDEQNETFVCFGFNEEDFAKSKAFIDRFGLFFDFNNPEELFLSDESDTNGVINFE